MKWYKSDKNLYRQVFPSVSWSRGIEGELMVRFWWWKWSRTVLFDRKKKVVNKK